MAEPLVVVSSTTTTRSPGATGPTILPPMPWSLGAARIENAFSGGAVIAVATATGSAPMVRPPTAVVPGGSAADHRLTDQPWPRRRRRWSAGRRGTRPTLTGAQGERPVGAQRMAAQMVDEALRQVAMKPTTERWSGRWR